MPRFPKVGGLLGTAAVAGVLSLGALVLGTSPAIASHAHLAAARGPVTAPKATATGTGSGGDLGEGVSLHNTSDQAFRSATTSVRSITTTNLGFSALSSPVRVADTRPGATDPTTYSGDTLGPGGSLTVDIPSADVPARAGAVVAQLTAIDPSASGYLSVYPAGGANPGTANVNFGPGQTVGNLVTVGIGPDPENGSAAVTVYNGPSGNTDFTLDLYGYYAPATATAGAPFDPVTPDRLMDTRAGSGQPGAGDTLGPGDTLVVPVQGNDGVSSNAGAADLNIAVTNTTATSYLECYPTGSAPSSATPTVNLIWTKGETLSAQAVLGVGNGGSVTCMNEAGSTDVIVDLDGYYTAPGGSGTLFNALDTPVRLLDTRPIPVPDGSSVTATLQGANASAGVLNVTDVATADNYLSAYPAGLSVPTAATVNYTTNDTSSTLANGSYATAGSGGGVDIYDAASAANVVVDEFGYFAPTTNNENGAVTSVSPDAGVPGTVVTATLAAPTEVSSVSVSGCGLTGQSVAAPNYSFTIPNSAPVGPCTLSFVVTLIGGGTETTTQSFTVVGPALAVTTTALSSGLVGTSYSQRLSASGGTAPYSWSVTTGSLPAGLSLSSSGAITGTPSSQGNYAFAVQVTDSTSPTQQTATAQLSISVLASQVQKVTSSNWSGYAVTGGPFTEAAGTFTVPDLQSYVPNSVVSEWVGIDGFPSGNNSLIQAGVDEMPYNASSFVVQPWWEILPTAETPITSMTVNAGDTVTVTIDEMSSSQWTITVTDETDSQSFTTDQYYDGPQTSAEWIVEAPTEGNTQTVLAPYTPDVAFSDLQTVGNQTSMAEITMVQNDEPVSTTSTYASSGFNVAYGSTAPPAPELSKNDVTTAGHHLTAVPAPSSSMLPQIYEIGRH